ncbi:MAG: peptide ABC transporter substrate-binding protein [Chloroflexota bacterium]
MRTIKAIAIACAAATLFSTLSAFACSTASVSGTLTMYASEPSTLDPALCGDATSGRYIVEIFSGLVTLNSELEVVPDIAESWDTGSDGTVYTFHLREGVTFHNGREVTARDFKYSIERAADPDTGSPVAAAYLGDIVGVKEKLRGEAEEVSGVVAVDDTTLEVTIDAAKAYFLSKLTHPTAFVVDRETVESGSDWWRSPHGTGPFRFQEWSKGQKLVLQRNDDYYRDTARLSTVTFVFAGSSMSLYETRRVDITPVGAGNIERVVDPTNPLSDEALAVSQLSVQYVGFNTGVVPLDDAKVRRALGHALDREQIVETLLEGLVSPADGMVPPGIPGFDGGVEALEYDVARAQELLAESDYAAGLSPIVLSVSGSCGGVWPVAEAIAWMWQENLGVEVEIEVVDFDTLLSDLWAAELQGFLLGWVLDYPDAENVLDLLFHSESVENHTGYSDPEVDRLLEKARVETDASIRLATYREAEQAIIEDAPVVPLWNKTAYYLVKPYVKGFSPPPVVMPVLSNIWLEK